MHIKIGDLELGKPSVWRTLWDNLAQISGGAIERALAKQYEQKIPAYIEALKARFDRRDQEPQPLPDEMVISGGVLVGIWLRGKIPVRGGPERAPLLDGSPIAVVKAMYGRRSWSPVSPAAADLVRRLKDAGELPDCPEVEWEKWTPEAQFPSPPNKP